MFVHTVFFYLKPELGDADRAAFERALENLGRCPQLQGYSWGRPVPSPRPVVVGGYDYAINCLFKTEADQDAYQDDPLHHDFIQSQKEKWVKIEVYDFM
ncbi:MAG: Dabb family protein [Verrucomicrobiota bacterium]